MDSPSLSHRDRSKSSTRIIDAAQDVSGSLSDHPQEAPRKKLHRWEDIRETAQSSSFFHNEAVTDLWQRHGSDNEHIISGYRPPSYSWRVSLTSIFSLHNETVNIHSHLLGALIFGLLPLYAFDKFYPRQSSADLTDLVVFAVFFYGVAACFLLSSSFHVVSSHSPKVAAIGNQLDYLGVVILMWGATIPTVYYGFYQNRRLQIVYCFLVSLLGVLCSVATCHPIFRTPSFRPYRAAMYASLGMSSLVSVGHGIMLHGWPEQRRRMSLDWMALMALLNLTGAVMYAARVPERLAPGRFDIVGSSHQILHFMVIFAGLAHTVGLFRAFEYTHNKDWPVASV